MTTTTPRIIASTGLLALLFPVFQADAQEQERPRESAEQRIRRALEREGQESRREVQQRQQDGPQAESNSPVQLERGGQEQERGRLGTIEIEVGERAPGREMMEREETLIRAQEDVRIAEAQLDASRLRLEATEVQLRISERRAEITMKQGEREGIEGRDLEARLNIEQTRAQLATAHADVVRAEVQLARAVRNVKRLESASPRVGRVETSEPPKDEDTLQSIERNVNRVFDLIESLRTEPERREVAPPRERQQERDRERPPAPERERERP